MGKNAQRRREARTPAATPANPSEADRQVAHLARRACDECGSTNIEWATVGDAIAAGWGGANAADGLRDAASMVGAEAEAWRCRSCGNFGFFGASSWG